MTRRRGLALVMGWGLGGLAAEGLLRQAAIERALLEPLVPLQVTDVGIHQPSEDPALLYTLRPGLDVELPPSSPARSEPRRVRTNSLGFRDPERDMTRPVALRVLCLGGSNTFGATVSDDQTWPAQLEQQLVARGLDAEAWNLGVSGWMTRQSVALAEQAIVRFEPDVVLVQVYNVGRRFLLLGDDVGRVLRLDPGLYAEWLWLAPPPGGPGWGLWRASALARGGVIALNRLAAAGGDPAGRLVDYTDTLDRQALTRLRQAHPEVAVLALVPPTGGPEVPIGSIDLHARYAEEGEPFGPEGRDIHPEPEVYGWVASQVAEALAERGLLGG